MSGKFGQDYEFHELCLLFPQADDKTIADMAEDIKENGLSEPILLYNGKILDGRNRYLACCRAGVEPTFKQYIGEEPLQFVISRNLHRRHLTDDQRAIMADRVIRLRGCGDDNAICNVIRNQFNITGNSLKRAGEIVSQTADEVQQRISEGNLSFRQAQHIIDLSSSAVGVVHKTRPTKKELDEMKKTQKKMLSDERYFDIINKKATEYQSEVLSGVYDGSRFRRDMDKIQKILAKMEEIPSLFNDAVDLLGTLDQERMLNAVLDSLAFNLKKAEKKFQSSTISYDEALSVVASLLNERFKLPELDQSQESRALDIIKAQYFAEAEKCLKAITDIRKRLNNRQ